MGKTAPVWGRSRAVAEALRVLQQVDSDLHLARLEKTGRELKDELISEGLAEPARIADRIADLANTRLRARSPLASRDLRTLQHECFRLARSLESPRRNEPSNPHGESNYERAAHRRK